VGGIQATYVEHTDFQKIKPLENDEPMGQKCWSDVRVLADQYGDGAVWTIPKSSLWEAYQHKGIGVELYERVIGVLKSRGKVVYLEPHGCLGNSVGTFGSTSEAAMRVWKHLVTRYPSSGPVIALK